MVMGDRGSVALFFAEDGQPDGPPVVLLGSLGSTVDMWRPQLPALTPRRRVIRVDHRGHGRSPVPPGPYTVADLAGDVVAVLDKLRLDRVDFVGISLGGMVGMYLASETPERINRLVLCATAAYTPNPSVWRERIAQVSEGGTESIADVTMRRWFTPEFTEKHPHVVAEIREMVRNTEDTGYLACCQALQDWDHRHRLGAITAPTLVIAGSKDASNPVEDQAKAIVDGIPNARLEVLDSAHLLTTERADEVNALITAHLDA